MKHMNLADAGHIEQREEALQRELRAGLFQRLASGALGHRFVELHEAGRQRPFAPTRLDVAFAKQNLAAPVGHGPDDDQGVLVVDAVADRADGALLRVAIVRNAIDRGRAAVLAVFDGLAKHGLCAMRSRQP